MFKMTPISSNAKTGRISTTMTVSKSCPSTCPLAKGGCYAKNSFVGMHWRKLDASGGKSLHELAEFISEYATRLWRHNVAGDLVHKAGKICADTLRTIIVANTGKNGFTYTHHLPNKHNVELVRESNARGFTVNWSANNLKEADELADLKAGPVVTLLPSTTTNNVRTPSGRQVVVCPAVTRDDVDCRSCGLCARSERKSIIGFPAHGVGKGKVDDLTS